MTRMQRLGFELTERQFNRNPFASSKNLRRTASLDSNLKPRDILILSFLAATFGTAAIVGIVEFAQKLIHFNL